MSDTKRRAWLASFLTNPTPTYAQFIAGYSTIHPYERADPPDVARTLFGTLEEHDPALAALDDAVLAWLAMWRTQTPPARPGPYQNWVRQLCETLEITYLLHLPKTSDALHQEQAMWEEVCGQHVIAPCRDPLATLRRTLALTQLHKS